MAGHDLFFFNFTTQSRLFSKKFPIREYGDKKIAASGLGPEFKHLVVSPRPFLNFMNCIALSRPPLPLQLRGNAECHPQYQPG